MSTLNANLPIGSPGAGVSTENMAKDKTIFAGGVFQPGDLIGVEVSPDGIVWENVATFTGPGSRNIPDALAFEMRAVLISGSAAGKNISVGAEEVMDNLYAVATAPVVPNPGTILGTPVDVSGLGPFKSFSVAGPMEGVTLIVKGSNAAPGGGPPPPNDTFAPIVQFVGTDETRIRDYQGAFNWLQVERLGGNGSGPNTIGIAAGGTTADSGPGVSSLPIFNEAGTEATVPSSIGFFVIGEEEFDFGAYPGANLQGKLDGIARSDLGPPGIFDWEVQIGGTPGNADGVTAFTGNVQPPLDVAPNGAGFGAQGVFVNPGAGQTLVKFVGRSVPVNGAYNSFIRGVTLQFGAEGTWP